MTYFLKIDFPEVVFDPIDNPYLIGYTIDKEERDRIL